VLYASMIKDTMKRKKPSFDESYYGYRSFTHLLEEADNLALVDIERNPKSGTYVVTRFGEEAPKELHQRAAPGEFPSSLEPGIPGGTRPSSATSDPRTSSTPYCSAISIDDTRRMAPWRIMMTTSVRARPSLLLRRRVDQGIPNFGDASDEPEPLVEEPMLANPRRARSPLQASAPGPPRG